MSRTSVTYVYTMIAEHFLRYKHRLDADDYLKYEQLSIFLIEDFRDICAYRNGWGLPKIQIKLNCRGLPHIKNTTLHIPFCISRTSSIFFFIFFVSFEDFLDFIHIILAEDFLIYKQHLTAEDFLRYKELFIFSLFSCSSSS